MDQVGVLAHETQTTADGKLSLQYGTSVDICPVGDRLFAEALDELCQPVKPVLKPGVIIVSPGIAGKEPPRRVITQVCRQGDGVIVRGHDHHRPHAGLDERQISSLGNRVGPGEIGHLSMKAAGQPALVAWQRRGWRGRCDARQTKAQALGLVLDSSCYS